MRKYSLYLFIMLLLCGAQAQAAAKPKVYLQLLEANTQRMEVDGRSKNVTQLLIIWKNIDIPATFFWRDDKGGWLPFKMERAHRTGTKKRIVYTTEEIIYPDVIHRGDTLKLTTVSGGKFPIPAEISPSDRNTLFFKSGGSNWLGFPVKNIVKR